MTLIITLATPMLIVQAGDRLLTQNVNGRTQQFDEKSNKSLIYEAFNGLLAISYRGKAFIQGKPTDEWIAEQLNSHLKIPSDGTDLWSLQMATGRPCNLLTCDRVIKVLRESLSSLAKSEFIQTGLTVVITGWKEKKKRIENVLIEITSESPLVS
ncbi:hypothetical protein [Pseudomonas tussilaginis]|uniref:hypothetical protein n=1 Tax=Pseudomonas putida TaxID=303 RepID=UPI002363BDB7|nr:hypothetical protein [Pseudomonas putida]MDD1976199.1 hypothetical protein [Pseudomonas putida]